MPRSIVTVESASETSDEDPGSNWENVSRTRTDVSARASSPWPSAHRKRKVGKPRRNTALSARAQRAPAPIIDRDECWRGLSAAVVFTFGYTADVVGYAIRLLRTPLAVLLFLWLLTFVFVGVSHILRASFAPLCVIPGISSSRMCVAPRSRGQGKLIPKWADYPKMVEVQSSTFEQLLDESAGGSGLSLEIKKAEMATADLVALVRMSDNLKSRDLLAESLTQFVNDAKKTGRGLQKLNSKIGGAVDGILAVNDYALHTIEAVADSPSRYSLRILLPWSWYSSRPTNEIVTQTFTEAMDALSNSMQRLILEAEVSLANLANLEEHLSTLHELISREDSSLSSAKSELLSDLWTKVGGNRRALRGYEEHLLLLKNLGGYRKNALVHVVSALQTLQAMSEDMEDLRERVAAPELMAGRIPVEVHMKSIKNGLERLREGRSKAKEREAEAIRRVLEIGDE